MATCRRFAPLKSQFAPVQSQFAREAGSAGVARLHRARGIDPPTVAFRSAGSAPPRIVPHALRRFHPSARPLRLFAVDGRDQGQGAGEALPAPPHARGSRDRHRQSLRRAGVRLRRRGGGRCSRSSAASSRSAAWGRRTRRRGSAGSGRRRRRTRTGAAGAGPGRLCQSLEAREQGLPRERCRRGAASRSRRAGGHERRVDRAHRRPVGRPRAPALGRAG